MTLATASITKAPGMPGAAGVLGETNRQVSATRWSFVVLRLSADSSGTQSASATVTADLNDDGTEETVGGVFARAGLDTDQRETVMFWLPPGATYSVSNNNDPVAGNSASAFETVH